MQDIGGKLFLATLQQITNNVMSGEINNKRNNTSANNVMFGEINKRNNTSATNSTQGILHEMKLRFHKTL